MKNRILNLKNTKMTESLGAVHTHTHTHTCSFIRGAQAFINHKRREHTLLR